MTSKKPYHIYTALTRAVDDYCERHGIGRGAFAIRIGFNGENADNQLSNHLNPRSMKNISHEREDMIMCELDDKAREIYFTMRAKEWGFKVDRVVEQAVSMERSFHVLADEAMIEGDEAFAVTKKALKDLRGGGFNKKQLKAIRKESKEASDFYMKMVDLAEEKLRGM